MSMRQPVVTVSNAERNEAIRNDAKNGMTPAQLAAKYFLSAVTIRGICKDVLPVRADIQIATVRNAQIVKDYLEGMDMMGLMRKHGVSQSAIWRAVKGLKRQEKQQKQRTYVNEKVMAEKKKPKPPEPEPQRVSLHSPVTVYHISDLPKQEQERIMKLRDPYRAQKKPLSGFVPRHV